ncbi:MAG: helix-turn-helix transcriptional regulator [Deltaproteobacteria bacterium]|nr:helix-turn-helix transcriptional regulator [Deltaproteobacteria bacterium]
MRMLSRSEEMVLLAVWKLKQEAYCVPIQDYLQEATGKKWSFSSIYNPLDRLEKSGLLDSFTTDPIKERGGRSKRIYRMTRLGREALREIRTIQDFLWEAAAELKP